MTRKTFVSKPPVHVLSAVATIVIDYIWFGTVLFQGLADNFEIAVALVTIIASLILGGICFLAVLLVQINLARDTCGPAVAKAIVMSLVAAVPLPVSGTLVGGVILSWAGIHLAETQIRKLLAR